MALPPLVVASLQSSILSGVSNFLAQVLTYWRSESQADFSINWIPVLQFMLFAVLNTPHNFLWQDFLESTFPAHPKPSPSTKDASSKGASAAPKLSIRNTVLKLVLDQTVGAAVNTMVVSMYIHSMDAAMAGAPHISSLPKALAYFTTPGAVDLAAVSLADIWSQATGEFWTILTASWRLWPAVALTNFTLVKTVQGRNLVGSLAGVGWGIYMSLVAAADKEA